MYTVYHRRTTRYVLYSIFKKCVSFLTTFISSISDFAIQIHSSLVTKYTLEDRAICGLRVVWLNIVLRMVFDKYGRNNQLLVYYWIVSFWTWSFQIKCDVKFRFSTRAQTFDEIFQLLLTFAVFQNLNFNSSSLLKCYWLIWFKFSLFIKKFLFSLKISRSYCCFFITVKLGNKAELFGHPKKVP